MTGRAAMSLVAAFVQFTCLSVALVTSSAVEAPGADTAPRWTTSRLNGSPEPPLPYRIKPAYGGMSFDRPVLVEPVPGSRWMIVGEVAGKLVAFEDRPDVTQKTVVGDLKALHADCTALYGLAFHPDFPKDRRVYIAYVLGGESADGTKLAEFRMTEESPPRLDLKSERRLLQWRGGGHNGGALAFGPDKKLYITTGDAGPASPPDIHRTGQDVTDFESSILRIDIESRSGDKPYGIPADNPFVGLPDVRPEIWAYGFRNPWKITFDKKTGDCWVGDVGWELWELVYRVVKGGNYGWAAVEGRQPVLKGLTTGPAPIRPPTIDHPHSEAASITGGYVLRDQSLKDLEGAYVYGDYQSGYVWAAKFDGVQVSKLEKIAESGLRLVSFGLDHSGDLLLMEHERSNGLFRLEKVPQAELAGSATAFPRKLSDTGLFENTQALKPAAGVRPYDVNVEVWADGATALRHMAIPPGANAEIDPATGRWRLPDGSVAARTVSLKTADSDTPRRMETQILMKQEGAWAAYSYLWNAEGTDATLAPAEGASIPVTLRDETLDGEKYATRYRVAARSECALCHNPWVEAKTTVYGRQSASPLGLFRPQLDHPDPARHEKYRDLLAWATGKPADVPAPEAARTLFDVHEKTASPERRARSWLAVHCSQCHDFNAGGAATIVLDPWAKTDAMRLLNVKPQQGDMGLGNDAFLVKPGAPEASVLFARIAKAGSGHMPRLGSKEIDRTGVGLIASWIEALDHSTISGGKSPVVEPGSNRIAGRLKTMAQVGTGNEANAREILRDALKTPEGALAVSRIELAGLAPNLRKLAREEAAKVTDPVIRDYVERLLPRSARIERLGDGFSLEEVLSLTGDTHRGESLFFAETGPNCASCHAVGDRGRNVGPALDGIGVKYDRTALLRHLIEPSLAVEPKWLPVTVATHDGRVLSGLKETLPDGRVKILDAKGETILKPEEIERLDTGVVSLMPVGLLRELTAEQAADLLAYLASLNRLNPGTDR
ncbi:c-type cytochrome [bacterium]|nr:c-type cytochrome [bacterium]